MQDQRSPDGRLLSNTLFVTDAPPEAMLAANVEDFGVLCAEVFPKGADKIRKTYLVGIGCLQKFNGHPYEKTTSSDLYFRGKPSIPMLIQHWRTMRRYTN